MPDHVHIFIGYKPSQPLPDLLRDIKANTSKFINEKKLLPEKFQWQEGYGVFSVSRSKMADLDNYIKNQKEHHRQRNYMEEYVAFLNKHGLKYDSRYVWG